MDGQKFDELVKQFCTTRLTRWSALRGLVAGAAATVTGAAVLSDDAEARARRAAAPTARARARARAAAPTARARARARRPDEGKKKGGQEEGRR